MRLFLVRIIDGKMAGSLNQLVDSIYFPTPYFKRLRNYQSTVYVQEHKLFLTSIPAATNNYRLLNTFVLVYQFPDQSSGYYYRGQHKKRQISVTNNATGDKVTFGCPYCPEFDASQSRYMGGSGIGTQTSGVVGSDLVLMVNISTVLSVAKQATNWTSSYN